MCAIVPKRISFETEGVDMANKRIRRVVAALLAAALGTTLVVTTAAHAAAAGCQVSYTVSSQWQGGFGASVAVSNLGDPINGWTLGWSFASGQTVTQLWNGVVSQSGAAVTVRDAGYNAAIATNASVSFGFNGAFTSGNAAPSAFTLNGVACTGGAGTPPPSTTPPPTTTPPPATCSATPVDPQATAAARRLLCYLYSQYGNHTISGQQESTWVDGPDYE